MKIMKDTPENARVLKSQRNLERAVILAKHFNDKATSAILAGNYLQHTEELMVLQSRAIDVASARVGIRPTLAGRIVGPKPGAYIPG